MFLLSFAGMRLCGSCLVCPINLPLFIIYHILLSVTLSGIANNMCCFSPVHANSENAAPEACLLFGLYCTQIVPGACLL